MSTALLLVAGVLGIASAFVPATWSPTSPVIPYNGFTVLALMALVIAVLARITERK